ncbi:MAG: alpha/beta hydrolase [Oscillospiraceae bacterium]|nr:alpha/beta hydrolase [Oscillospiraceae bacterium]
MRLNIDGIDLYYMDIGPKDSDETVVLLHGWGANSSLYRSITDKLSAKRRVIAPDFPGFGETAEPGRPWEVKDFADCAVKLIEALELKKVALYGHSHGGRVSLDIAAREDLPFELTRMVLMDAAGVLPKKTLKQRLRQKRYKIARTILSWGWVKALYPDALENLRRSHGSADYQNASPMMRQTLVKVVNTSMEWAMPKVKVPTLLLWGEKDTATPISDGERMEQLIPGAGLARIPEAGHFCYIDQWPLVSRVLEAFFDPAEVK